MHQLLIKVSRTKNAALTVAVGVGLVVEGVGVELGVEVGVDGDKLVVGVTFSKKMNQYEEHKSHVNVRHGQSLY